MKPSREAEKTESRGVAQSLGLSEERTGRDETLVTRIVGGALAVFAAVASLFPLRSYDLFWHLATGRWIWEHGQAPRTDPFRFTSETAPWVDHGWLFQLLLHAIERMGGLDALVLLRAALVITLGGILFWLARKVGGSAGFGGALVLLALFASRPRWMLRPELGALVLLALFMVALEGWRMRRTLASGALPVAIAAMWANVHASVLVAPVLAGLYALGLALQEQRDRPWRRVPLLPAACAAAIALNPYGIELYAVPWRIREALGQLPLFNPEWLPLWKAPQPAYFAGLFLIAALVAAAIARREKLDFASGFVCAALAGLAATGVRHLGVFFVGALPFAARALAAATGGLASSARRAAAIATTAGALLAAVWCAAPPASGPLRPRQGPQGLGFGIEEALFPVRAADVLEQRWPEVTRLYHDVAFGGYLIWRFYPERRAFIDGRNEVNPALLAEVAGARSDSRLWRALLDHYGIEGALVRYDERLRRVVSPGKEGRAAASYRTTHALLFPQPEFHLVYWDDVGMLFVRRGTAPEEKIAAHAYRFVHPEDWRHWLERARNDPAYARAARAELERKLAEDPACARARFLLQKLEVEPRAGTGDPPLAPTRGWRSSPKKQMTAVARKPPGSRPSDSVHSETPRHAGL